MPRKILLVQDTTSVVSPEGSILQEHGFEVETATATTVMDRIGSADELSLVLIDIDADGEQEGLDIAEKILEKLDLPVLFLLDASTSLSRKSERKIDVYGYIPKGSDVYFLIRSIESALQLFAAHAHEKEQVKELDDTIKAFQGREKRTEALLQALPDHLFIFDEGGTFLEYHVSRSHSLFIQPKQFLGKKMHELFPKDISTTAQELITEALRTGKIQTFEYQLKISDASRYFEAHLSPFEKDKVLCIVRENTTLKESEAKYSSIFHNSNISLWEEDFSAAKSIVDEIKKAGITDIGPYVDEHPEVMTDFINAIKVIDVNYATQKLYGAESKDDLIGSLYKTVYFSEDNRRFMTKEIIAVAEGKPYIEGEMKVKRLDGRILDIQISISLLYEQENRCMMIVAITDITPLKTAIQEKNDLMRELNHRVKNNLTMISSLINLKNAELGTTVDLSDISHQIEAIGLIHEKLYQSENISFVPLHEYIRDLLDTVFSSFTLQHVTLESSIPEISLETKRSIYVGLIINEMATNAIKHGFNRETEARFSVEMKQNNEKTHYILTVTNTGVPFPEDIHLDNPKTLGLQLISTLVNQIRGTLELQKSPHTMFTVKFPVDPK